MLVVFPCFGSSAGEAIQSGCRNIDLIVFQAGIDDPAMFFNRKLIFHRGIAKDRKRKLATETFFVKNSWLQRNYHQIKGKEYFVTC